VGPTPQHLPLPARRTDLPYRRLVGACLLTCLLVLAACLGTARAATVTVSMNVGSQVSMTDNCGASSAHDLGTVLPGSSALSATGSSVCSFSFQSNNDSAMVRLGQRDGAGNAMGTTAGTWSTSYPDDSMLQSVGVSPNGQVIWAGGRTGILRQSRDGGTTWTEYPNANGTYDWVYDVQPSRTDPTVWFAVSANRKVLRITAAGTAAPVITDIGATLPAGIAASYDLDGVVAFDTNTVWVVGSNGWVAKTANASAAPASVTWTGYQLGTTRLLAIAAVNATTMYIGSVYTGSGSVWKTTTGGGNAAAWSIQALPHASDATGIAVADATHVYAVQSSGYAAFSSGGAWVDRSISSLTADDLADVTASATVPGTAIVVGSFGEVFRTIDSGVTWSRVDSRTGVELQAVTTPDGSKVIAVGDDRTTIISANGATGYSVVASSGGAATAILGVAADPENGQVLVSVGSGGLIRRSTDRGSTWTTVAGGLTTEALFDVSFGPYGVAWAVGENGTIARSSDDGLTWSLQASGAPPGTRLWDVVAVDQATAFAAGDGGILLRTTSGGASWAMVSTGTTNSLRAVGASPSGATVIAAGLAGTMLRSTDGGATWSAVAGIPATEHLMSVDFATETNAVVATRLEFVWRTTDGGVTWNSIDTFGWAVQYRVVAIDRDSYVVTGAWGAIMRSDDGGSTWTSASLGGTSFYYSVAVGGRGTMVLVGSSGSTARSTPSGAAAAQVADYGAAPANWAGTGNTSAFGVCLQAVGAGTTVNTGAWTLDGNATCTASDADPWRAVPATPVKVAQTSGAGAVGRIDLVWGARLAANQQPTRYSATVVVEALAPAV
jgi:photosystem II stability/assembly factor-like uncharacterized protein